MDALEVKVGKLPGQMNTLALEEGATVQDALDQAEIDPSGYEVRLNGETIDDFDDEVNDGDTVILVKKIKGN